MNEAAIKVLIIIGIGVAIFAAGATVGWTANGWRLGKDLEHEKQLTTAAVDQAKINKAAADSCTASVVRSEAQAREILKLAAGYLERALELAKKHLVASQAIEDLLKKGNAPKDCHAAWQILEQMHKGASAPGAP